MKKLASVLVLLALALSLTACGSFKCDICQEEKSGGKNTENVFGQEITYCDDCKEALESLGSIE